MGHIQIGTIGFGLGKVAPKHLGDRQKYGMPILPPVPQVARQFFEQKMFYWKGQFYTRADVIKWLANRFGWTQILD